MGLLRFLPIQLALCLIFGILLGKYIALSYQVSGYLILLSLTILGLFLYFKKHLKSIFFGIVTWITMCLIGMFVVSISQAKNNPNHYTQKSFEKEVVWTIKIKEKLKSNSYSDRYIVWVKSLIDQPVMGKMLLRVAKDTSQLQFHVDEEFVIYSQAQELNAPLNPHEFNYKTYMENLGVFHQLSISKNSFKKRLRGNKTIFGIADSFRKKIVTTLKNNGIQGEALAIIQALLLGQRNDIDINTYNNYKEAGAIHILAVSGLHIGVLLLILQFLFKPLERFPKGQTFKLIIILLLLWGFAVIAGLSPSVVRAVTMFSFVAYAQHLNRSTNTVNVLALSLMAILLLKPSFLFEVGFQMSYAAVFAIVWVYPIFQRLWHPTNWIIKKMWQLLSISLAAQLGVLPIGLFYFHQFPGLFFVSNLIVVPFLGFLLIMDILLIGLALANLLPNFLSAIYTYLIDLMNTIIAWIANQEAFILREISFDAIQLVLSYIVIFGAILTLSRRSFRHIFLLLFGIISLQGYGLITLYQTQHKRAFLVAHKSRNTALFDRNGQNLSIITADSSSLGTLVSNYKIGERITNITYATMQHNYMLGDKKIVILDRSGVYLSTAKNIDVLLLTQSPKIHLEQLISELQPKLVIADGSNYPSFVARWKTTCSAKKIPFHDTRKKGAYQINILKEVP